MGARRRTRRIGSALLTVGLLAVMAATAVPAVAATRAATRTKVTASPRLSAVGQPVTLTATVSFAMSGEQTPTGSASFTATHPPTTVYLGSAPVTDCSLVTRKCTATLVTTALPLGRDRVRATYSGDRSFQPSRGVTAAKVTTALPPGAPTLTQAVAGDAQVALEWSAPTTGGPASTYNVYRSDTQGVQGPAIATGVSATTYTDASAVNDFTYYYVVTAVNGAGESPPSNELSARPPSSAAAAAECSASNPCTSPPVSSPDGSTDLLVTSDPSAGPQTLTVQVGGLTAMQCSLPGSGSVIVEYHTTAPDAAKVADYTTHGDAAQFAQDFYAAHTDISVCYGSPDPFNGWSPSGGGATWADGPYAYGPAGFDEITGLYEAFLGSCANHSGYQPCFVNINGLPTYHTSEVRSPASATDPRVSN